MRAAAALLGPALALAAAGCGSRGGGASSDGGTGLGTSDAPIVQVDAGCGATLTDPHNCGGCGIECEGGVCVEGVCSPPPPGVLASGQTNPVGIVVDDANVYWMNRGAQTGTKATPSQIMKCAKTGCGNAPTVLGTGGWISSTPLALHDGTLYWAIPNNVLSCPIDGCPAGPTVLSSEALQPMAIATGASGVFVGDSTQMALLLYPFADGGASSTLVWGSATPTAIAVDTSGVYFATSGVSLLRCDGDAGGCKSVVIGGSPTVLGTDGTNVYMGGQSTSGPPAATAMAGSVAWCKEALCPSGLTVVTNRVIECNGVAGDGTNVYFSDQGVHPSVTSASSGLGRVSKCPLAGCAGNPTAVAGFVNYPQQIAIDDNNVYWTDFGSSTDPTGTTDGRVMMSPK